MEQEKGARREDIVQSLISGYNELWEADDDEPNGLNRFIE
jgi:hypothetical protein